MLCQKCEKNNALVHLTETRNGETKELFLCGICAAGSGIGINPISFASFMGGFMDACSQYDRKASSDITKCENCGITLTEVKKHGKVGCSHCYNVFKSQIETIIKKVQSSSCHTGKYPKSAEGMPVKREIAALKKQLAAAIEKEEYELAAEIRDSMRALEGGRSNE